MSVRDGLMTSREASTLLDVATAGRLRDVPEPTSTAAGEFTIHFDPAVTSRQVTCARVLAERFEDLSIIECLRPILFPNQWMLAICNLSMNILTSKGGVTNRE